MSAESKTFTVGQLAALGMRGDVYPDDWDSPNVVDVKMEVGGFLITFQDEDGQLWCFPWTCYPGDWAANCLSEYVGDYPIETTRAQAQD